MYTITSNGTTFGIENKDGKILVNGQPVNIDIYKIDAQHAHILIDNKSYRARIESTDYTAKTFTFIINNHTYKVDVKDRFDLLLKELGMDKAASSKAQHVFAPMPGLVLRLIAEAGVMVKKGDSLLVLEAMKMENIIKAPADMMIKNIKVKAQQAVEKGEMLVEVE